MKLPLVKDIRAILQGAAIVAEKVIVRQKPELTEKITRAQYHAKELFNALMDIERTVSSTDDISKPNSPNQNTENQTDVNVAKVKTDKLGFDSLRSEDDVATEAVDSSPKPSMKEREVPSTQVSRLVGFGSLAARMVVGKAAESATDLWNGTQSNRRISDKNAERLAETLCRMRGASLKLGQMLSVQDEHMLPPAISKALERVKQSADYMPKHQLYSQLTSQLGSDWKSEFAEFNDIPVAAASIGQVHKGTLKDGRIVAVKVQYPGVADSITSDLNNLKTLISLANVLPEGLFVEQIIKVANDELAVECDYEAEARHQTRYRNLILQDSLLSQHTAVPEVIPHLSSQRVLTSMFVAGSPIDKAANLSQPVRNAIARTILISTFRELFEWKFIQSDPNFANFLYDHSLKRINFIDFGAAREYSKAFVDGYMRLVWAAGNNNREEILAVSTELGFLTGDETREMQDAHVSAGLVIGEPFLHSGPYDFGTSKLTARIGQYGDTFAKHRLTPPPTEAYSLHRKLAGAFLLCIRLKANIPCRDVLEETYQSYKF